MHQKKKIHHLKCVYSFQHYQRHKSYFHRLSQLLIAASLLSRQGDRRVAAEVLVVLLVLGRIGRQKSVRSSLCLLLEHPPEAPPLALTGGLKVQ